MLRLIGGVVVYGMALYGAIQLLERYKGAVLICARPASRESDGVSDSAEEAASETGVADATQAG